MAAVLPSFRILRGREPLVAFDAFDDAGSGRRKQPRLAAHPRGGMIVVEGLLVEARQLHPGQHVIRILCDRLAIEIAGARRIAGDERQRTQVRVAARERRIDLERPAELPFRFLELRPLCARQIPRLVYASRWSGRSATTASILRQSPPRIALPPAVSRRARSAAPTSLGVQRRLAQSATGSDHTRLRITVSSAQHGDDGGKCEVRHATLVTRRRTRTTARRHNDANAMKAALARYTRCSAMPSRSGTTLDDGARTARNQTIPNAMTGSTRGAETPRRNDHQDRRLQSTRVGSARCVTRCTQCMIDCPNGHTSRPT